MTDLNKIYKNKDLISLADKYSPFKTDEGQVTYSKILKEKYDKINISELKVPVLGIQGSGKSSLINSILFDDLLLPVDAAETTCVPVEIRYHDKSNVEIIILFEGNKDEISLSDFSELESYVNNVHNPGNKKGVIKAIIKTKNELLKNDIVLVDLPGVGSLTKRNEKTTFNYLKDMSYALFLLRTVPPITKSESIFLTLAWPQLINAMFIQNRWTDESQDEVEQGKAHNLRVLDDIAKSINLDGKVELTPVNIYKALQGKLDSNEEMIKNSNLEKVMNYIRDLGNNWRELLKIMLNNYIQNLLINIKSKIEYSLSNESLTLENLKKKLDKEEKLILEMIKKNELVITKIKNKIENYYYDLKDFVTINCQEAKEDLRNEMRNRVNTGIVDGNKLTIAFTDCQIEISNDTMERIMLKIEEIQRDLRIDIDELEIREFKGNTIKLSKFQKESAMKIEKILPPTASAGGALAGAAAGASIGGMLGLAGGPLVIVGVVIGAIGGFLGGWLGMKAKSTTVEIRGNNTMKELEKYFDDFELNLFSVFENPITDLIKYLNDTLEFFKKNQKIDFEDQKLKNKDLLSLDINERKNLKKELEKDFDNTIKLLNEMEKMQNV